MGTPDDKPLSAYREKPEALPPHTHKWVRYFDQTHGDSRMLFPDGVAVYRCRVCDAYRPWWRCLVADMVAEAKNEFAYYRSLLFR